jgi:hypothetical protein
LRTAAEKAKSLDIELNKTGKLLEGKEADGEYDRAFIMKRKKSTAGKGGSTTCGSQ